jgi:hypothetical protein
MKLNLDSLKQEIREYLDEQGFAVFRGFVSELHEQKLVLWDVERDPDYRAYLDCARRCGVKVLIYNHRVFKRDMIEDAMDRLDASDLGRDDARAIERRLKELRSFEGFTCSVEMAFDLDGRFYVFDLRTEWYEELLDLLDQIESAVPELDGDDEEDDSSMGGYFSRN